MSDVLDYVRERDPRFRNVPDDELTRYVGERHPQFLEDERFSKRFELVNEQTSARGEKLPSYVNPLAREPNTANERERRKRALQGEQMAERRSGQGADFLMGLADAAEFTTDTVSKMNPLTVVPRLAWNVNQMTKAPEEQSAFPLDNGKTIVPVEDWTGDMVREVSGYIGGPFRMDVGPNSESVAGALNAANDFSKFFLTPEGLSVLGAGAAPKAAQAALAAGFAGQMASGVDESAQQAGTASVEGTPAEAMRAGLGAAANVAFAGGIPIGAIKAAQRPHPLLEAARLLAEKVNDPEIAVKLERAANELAIDRSNPEKGQGERQKAKGKSEAPEGMFTAEAKPWEGFARAGRQEAAPEVSKVELPVEQSKVPARSVNWEDFRPVSPEPLEGQPYDLTPPESAPTGVAIGDEPWKMTRREYLGRTGLLPAVRNLDTGEVVVGQVGQIHAMLSQGPDVPIESGWVKDGRWISYEEAASLQPSPDARRTWDRLSRDHAASVTVAFASGLPVPSEVLADYPGLRRVAARGEAVRTSTAAAAPAGEPLPIGKENAVQPGTAAKVAEETGTPRSREAGQPEAVTEGQLPQRPPNTIPFGRVSDLRSRSDSDLLAIKPSRDGNDYFVKRYPSRKSLESFLKNPGEWTALVKNEVDPNMLVHRAFQTESKVQAVAPGVEAPKPTAGPGDDLTQGQSKPAQPGGKATENVVETPEPIKPKKIARGNSLASRFTRETEIVGHDILEWINEQGGFMSKSAARSKGVEFWNKVSAAYDDATPLQSPHHNVVYRGTRTPDVVAEAAYRAGQLSEPSASALWDAMDRASRARKGTTSKGGAESQAKQIENYKADIEEHQAWAKATGEGGKGKFEVSNEMLAPGDVLEVDGERVEVIGRDAATGDLTLKDGKKFGRQVLEDGRGIYVEKWVEHASEPKAAPGELFGTESNTSTSVGISDEGGATVIRVGGQKVGEGKLIKGRFVIAPNEFGDALSQNQQRAVLDALDAHTKEYQRQKIAEGQRKTLGGQFSSQGDLLDSSNAQDPLFAQAPSGGINSGALGEVGMGGAKPGEFRGNFEGGIGIKNAKMKEMADTLGLSAFWESLAEERQGHEQVWNEVMAKLDDDPDWPKRIVAEVNERPRQLSAHENLAVLHRLTELKIEEARASREILSAYEDSAKFPNRKAELEEHRLRHAQFVDAIKDVMAATRSAGREWGRAGVMRQRLMEADFSLAKMEIDARAIRGGRALTEKEMDEVLKHHKAIADAALEEANRAVGESERRAAEAIAELERRVKAEPTYDPRILRTAEEIVVKLERKAKESDAKIREMLSRMSAGLDPELLYHLGVKGAAMIARKGLDVSKFTVEMAAEYGDKIKPYMKEIWDRANLHLDNEGAKYGDKSERVKRLLRKRDEAGRRESIVEGLQKAKAEGQPVELLGDYVRRLAESFVRAGVREREALIDAVHGVLTAEFDPEMTRRETMDAISGYGKFKALNPDEVKTQLRDLRGQMQQLAKLEDIEAKKPLLKTGVERRTQSDEERRLIQQVNEAKRRHGVVVSDPARQLKSALDARRTALKHRVADLEYQIATKARIVKTKTPTPHDAETLLLETRRDELKRQLDELVPKPGLTDEQLLHLAERSVEREVAHLEERIKNRDVSPRMASRERPNSPKLEALRARQTALRAELEELRAHSDAVQAQRAEASLAREKAALERGIEERERKLREGEPEAAGRPVDRPASDPALEALKQRRDELNRQLAEARRGPKKSPEEIALAAYKTRLARLAASYEERLARKDFTPHARREIRLDPEALRAKAKTELAKKDWEKAKLKAELEARGTVARVADLLLRIRREFVISRLSAIDKLLQFSLQEFALTPVKEAVGAVGARLPLLRDIAAKSSAEVGGGVRGIVNDYVRAFTQGIKDAKDTATRGESDLKAAYDPRIRMEGEFKGFFGTLHQMEKSPLIRMNFERSFRRRMDYAARAGADVTDVGVMQRVGVAAYQDALRGALINRNELVAKVGQFVNRLADKDKVTGRESVPGKIARFAFSTEFPVQHVPVNYVARTLEYVAGLPMLAADLGGIGWRGAHTPVGLEIRGAWKRGIETLGEEEANLIFRHLKSGSVGSAVMLMGFFLPQMFGGLNTKGPKDKDKTLKAGEVQVGDVVVPKHRLHNPLVNAAQFGATVRQIADAKLHKRDAEGRGLSAGAEAAIYGLAHETPYVREIENYLMLVDPYRSSSFKGEHLKGYLVPGLVSEAAEYLDKNAVGDPVRRYPTTLEEHIKSGLPYYRQDVPDRRPPVRR